MFGGTTARTALAVLAAVLLALPLLASAVPFAPAHAARHAEAKAQSGIKPSGTTLRNEAVAGPDVGYVGGPAFPLSTLHQNRAADSAPQPSERPLLVAQDPAAAEEPAALSAGHHSLSRTSTAHFPAALQVFRC
ncbi:hypothetical protein HW130_14110 [Streptomyces sp. PKU-EA00015]|uniref:hypothetical protein n=1 Tax=Streptomyces sp. PKU-EA00015 TaxID=2748326 RepID=UPI0015A0E584|nr:hypothetical protein [Streptomyces sp. PKU-EA00015]NWF27391.1 hypothetical protein [Streptomyces sp. PKU-EA00015]